MEDNDFVTYQINNYTQKRKKYTTITVTIIIVLALLLGSSILYIIWSLTDKEHGILLRQPRKSVNDVDYMGEYSDLYLLKLDKYIPTEIQIKQLDFNTDNYGSAIMTLSITNNSKYNTEVRVITGEQEKREVNIRLLVDEYSVDLQPYETRIVEYEIYNTKSSSRRKYDIIDLEELNLYTMINCYENVDFDDGTYHYLEVKNGKITWDNTGDVKDIYLMDTWGYCSLYEIDNNTYINN